MHQSLVLLATAAIIATISGSPITGGAPNRYEPAANTAENIALIESGVHRQKIEELSGQFEGDIVLTAEQREAINGNLRTGLVNTTYRWPGKVVPVEFTADLNEAQRAEVLRGLRAIEAAAPCISFVNHTDEVDFVQVHGKPTGCWSMVGRIGGMQQLNLQLNGCVYARTIVHEFLHALGFYHMQSSYERDAYVRVAWEHIQDGLAHNFNQYEADRITNFGHEYDIRSIMHYSAYSFTKNGFATMIPNVSVDLGLCSNLWYINFEFEFYTGHHRDQQDRLLRGDERAGREAPELDVLRCLN